MANNVKLPTQGTGTTEPNIATDDVGGVHYQWCKLDVGAIGASVPVAGALPVTSKVDLTPSAPAAASVGVASAQAVAANAARKGLVLVNVSPSARISFGLGANAAVLDSGITLYPGGVWVMDEFTYDLGAVNAIASAATTPLSIQEFST